MQLRFIKGGSVLGNRFGEFRELAIFSWEYPVSGFYWENNLNPLKSLEYGTEREIHENEYVPKPLLIENPEVMTMNRYLPLDEESALFLKFSDIDISEEGILKFANKYGRLWANHGYLIGIEQVEFIPKIEVKSKEEQYKLWFPEVEERGNSFIIGEPFIYWETEIISMRNAVRLWKWIESEDIGKLSFVVNWDRDGGGFDCALGEINDIKLFRKLPRKEQRIMGGEYNIQYRFFNENVSKEVLYLTKKGDIILPAKILLNDIINTKLKNHPLHLRLLLDENNYPKQFVVPESLLGAMWYQFFQSITGEKKYKKCAVCGTWENVNEKREDWLYHDSCGSTFRSRKKRGLMSIIAGKKTVEEVAENCGVSVSVVKQWIEDKK